MKKRYSPRSSRPWRIWARHLIILQNFGLVKRNKGRIALLRAHAHVAGAELQLYKCHLLDLNFGELFEGRSEKEKEMLKKLLDYLVSKIPEVMEMFKPFIQSGVETLKAETLLLIAQASIAFVELQTVGVFDSIAVKTITKVTNLLEFICTGLEEGFGDGSGN